MRANKPSQVLDADDVVDLADDLGSVQSRARVYQHRLIALFHQVHVALELVSGKQGTDPPDSRSAVRRLARCRGSRHPHRIFRFRGSFLCSHPSGPRRR